MPSKARLFASSSREGLPLANAVFSELERDTEPTVWDHLFEPMRDTLEDLDLKLRNFDFAVHGLPPDHSVYATSRPLTQIARAACDPAHSPHAQSGDTPSPALSFGPLVALGRAAEPAETRSRPADLL